MNTLTIDVERHRECINISNLVRCHQPWPQGTECRAALAFHPVASALKLIRPLRDIVADTITSNVIGSFIFSYIGCGFTNHDCKFHFPICLLRSTRDKHSIIWANNAGGCLIKQNRLFRHSHSTLRRMVCVVETNSDEIANASNA